MMTYIEAIQEEEDFGRDVFDFRPFAGWPDAHPLNLKQGPSGHRFPSCPKSIFLSVSLLPTGEDLKLFKLSDNILPESKIPDFIYER